MAANVEGDNNYVGVDCKIEVLEEAFEIFREEQHVQFQNLQDALARFTLNTNNRRPKVASGHAGCLAHGALAA